MSASSPAHRPPTHSLRARVALLVGLPILAALVLLSLSHFWRAKHLAEERVEATAQQIGDITLGNLDHVMMLNDSDMLSAIFADLGKMQSISLVQIIDLQSRVRVASDDSRAGSVQMQSEVGCVECHRFPAADRPRTARLTSTTDTLRISTPIDNRPGCTGCHGESSAHLGVLLIDVSLVETQRQLLGELSLDLVISLVCSSLLTLGAYLVIHHLVVRRVEAFRAPLARLASGDFSARLPSPSPPADELEDLAQTFNRMAQDLEHHAQAQEERTQVRLNAIIEERERIARELHDGLAQLLGYVNTKASAVRLLLKDGKQRAASRHLSQLEEAARHLFIDVRAAILGLKLAASHETSFTVNLEYLARHFARLSDLTVNLTIDQRAEALALPPESGLQLLRICQEALTNIRKHAAADEVNISLGMEDHSLLLVITDAGSGFDTSSPSLSSSGRFGLSMMKERAAEIGATVSIQSNPDRGTRVCVRLPLKEES